MGSVFLVEIPEMQQMGSKVKSSSSEDASSPNLDFVASYRRRRAEADALQRRRRNAEVDGLIREMATDPKVAEKLRIYRMVEEQFQEIESQVHQEVTRDIRQKYQARQNTNEKAPAELSYDVKGANELFKKIDRMKKEATKSGDEKNPFEARARKAELAAGRATKPVVKKPTPKPLPRQRPSRPPVRKKPPPTTKATQPV